MHRYRALCERAVDPLEIAAGLEAHGVTDRTAARFRHRDVFSLADELFARVPGRDSAGEPAPYPAATGGSRVRNGAAGAVVHLLPGVLSALTLGVLALDDTLTAPARIAVGLLGTAAVGAAVRVSLRRISRSAPAVLLAISAYWLLAYGLFGNWLLAGLLGDGPAADGPSGFAGATAPASVLAGMSVPLSLMFAVAVAAFGVRWFGAKAQRRLAGSRSLDEFATGVRPLLAMTVGLFAVALTVLQVVARSVVEGSTRAWSGAVVWGMPGTGELAQTTALGVLLFAALLLATHGFPSAASVGLGAASLIEAGALAVAVAARSPELHGAGGFLKRAVEMYGPGSVPAVACGCAALALSAYAFRALAGASAHHREVRP